MLKAKQGGKNEVANFQTQTFVSHLSDQEKSIILTTNK